MSSKQKSKKMNEDRDSHRKELGEEPNANVAHCEEEKQDMKPPEDHNNKKTTGKQVVEVDLSFMKIKDGIDMPPLLISY